MSDQRSDPWQPGTAGLLRLPSGRAVRGRGLGYPLPEGPRPEFALYLLDHEPPTFPWTHRWVRWEDFGLPADPADTLSRFRQALERAGRERVELACLGGRGRTGTALACLAVLDGLPAGEAVSYVREHYSPHAVETPEQEAYVRAFTP
ncbi:protein-tyrosine phosphatase [Nocardiopsis terrae]|uniref:Protein-tyrosine phosphatase n=1 Tax=Nocardiopsis terrae TaxID=372655 RepID=A0ABR9HB55_9ACTN|nr:protein-tyrosine phosphatase family protein [Nocardiopsis terrae]MBE1456262.1 protein-tyrosine phosphatase [Nocardiopsis terrae]